ncbi:hypothetical protein [Arenimonas donghaensis]|uniref:Uncharacterized protein n=1 Tax=Arenimonas donghaensis DSM 18148 = HO3-R19 TaxID=1121014 RepID=A0A087MHP9_9GAMM|nr:hypothetical protein [Arenimonas donghaensis]KFL36402.1 hypothetical protein N788_13235 [Arenimonas donghaensis DSM 18148 = HO3-R19]
MRIALGSFIAATLLLTGCGGDVPDEQASGNSSKARAIIAAAADEASKPSGEPGSRALANPLPGGVVPDFAYNATVDMSTQVGVTIRQVHLDVPGLGSQEAMDRLVAQFEAAGLVAGEQASEKNTLVRSVWTPGEDGAKGLAVVDGGGTHIALMGTDYEAGHSRRDDGYASALRLQINTK